MLEGDATKMKKLTQNMVFYFQILSRIVTVEGKNKNYTYLDLVRTPKMRKLAICTGIIWYMSQLDCIQKQLSDFWSEKWFICL